MADPDKNWDLFISCRDCEDMYGLGEELVNWSLEVLETGNRILLLTIPQQCPNCRNLKLVPQPDGDANENY